MCAVGAFSTNRGENSTQCNVGCRKFHEQQKTTEIIQSAAYMLQERLRTTRNVCKVCAEILGKLSVSLG